MDNWYEFVSQEIQNKRHVALHERRRILIEHMKTVELQIIKNDVEWLHLKSLANDNNDDNSKLGKFSQSSAKNNDKKKKLGRFSQSSSKSNDNIENSHKQGKFSQSSTNKHDVIDNGQKLGRFSQSSSRRNDEELEIGKFSQSSWKSSKSSKNWTMQDENPINFDDETINQMIIDVSSKPLKQENSSEEEWNED